MIGSKITDIQKGVYGHVDFIDERGIGGWILDIDGGVNVVEVYMNGIKVAEKEASIHREDIDRVVGNVTNCGFFITWREIRIFIDYFADDKLDIHILHSRSKDIIVGNYNYKNYKKF